MAGGLVWDPPGDSPAAGSGFQSRGGILTGYLFSQPAVELPPFNGSDLCVEGISVKKAKKQMPPIASVGLSESLLDAPPKVRSARALMETVIRPPRTTVRQDWKREEAKVLSTTWSMPVMDAEVRGRAKPIYAFEVNDYQHVDNKSHKSGYTRVQSSKVPGVTLTSAQHPALFAQTMKPTQMTSSPPPTASGNHRDSSPFCPIVFEELWLHPNSQRRPSSCILQSRAQGWIRGIP
jgi:hypothetical protein